MIATLMSLIWPITVIVVAGVVVLGIAWWATLAFEEHDDFLWQSEDQS